jgi:MFS family permease
MRIFSVETRSNVFLSRSFLLSFFSFFFLWISFDFFILFPLFILQSGGDSVDVGFQTFLFFFPAVIMRPLAGWLTDRIGRLRVLWFGSTLMVLTALSLLLLKGTYEEMKYWMGLILFMRGLAFAAFYTAFFTYIVDLSLPQNRGRVIGMFGVSGLVAHGLAPWIAENVLERYNFTGFFTISAALSMISLLISAALKEKHKAGELEEGGWSILKRLTFNNRNLIILPGAFVFGYVVASFNTFGAPYFKEVGGATTGKFFLAYGLTAGTVRVIFGGVADLYSRWKLVAIFFFLQGLGLLLLLLEPVGRYYLIAGAVSGGAHGILFPSLSAMAIDAHPQLYRGVVASIFTGTMELGFSLGSYLLGVIVAISGYKTMFASAIGIAIIYSAYVVVLQVTKRNLTQPVES